MAEAKPTSTPLPVLAGQRPRVEESKPASEAPMQISSEPQPVFRLHLNDLSHPASSQFLGLVDGARVLPNALSAIRKHLYPSPPANTNHLKSRFQLPPTRSVTLVLRPMDGVAYTTGIDLDSAHKEIHFNLNYIRDCTDKSDRRRHEIIGVVTHEMVHCYQYDGSQTAPGGLIEGIADFVRLKADLGPPHWFDENGKPKRGTKWDAGYQNTAFFLDWLEENNGLGTVGRINEALREGKYDEQAGFWEELFGKGKSIDVLWSEYCADQDQDQEHDDGMDGQKRNGSQTHEENEVPSESATATARDSVVSDDIVIVENDGN